MFQTTGVPGCIESDCASNFCSELTRTFLSMLGCTPRFNVPGRPQQTGVCERLICTLKSMIANVAMDYRDHGTNIYRVCFGYCEKPQMQTWGRSIGHGIRPIAARTSRYTQRELVRLTRPAVEFGKIHCGVSERAKKRSRTGSRVRKFTC